MFIYSKCVDVRFKNSESIDLYLLQEKLDQETYMAYELSLKDIIIPWATSLFLLSKSVNKNKSSNHESSENSKRAKKCIWRNEDSHRIREVQSLRRYQFLWQTRRYASIVYDLDIWCRAVSAVDALYPDVQQNITPFYIKNVFQKNERKLNR